LELGRGNRAGAQDHVDRRIEAQVPPDAIDAGRRALAALHRPDDPAAASLTTIRTASSFT
jgi:hypothetical protein